MAIKSGIYVLNTPGTIDADYRGEIGIIIVNLSNEVYTIKDGERICQMIVTKHERLKWNEVDKLREKERGKSGFGHTCI